MKTLDITNEKQKGQALADHIENLVKDTQRWIIQPLPSEILMTRKQFNDLLKQAKMPEMYESKDRLYQTKMNVMEVRVQE